MGAEELIEVGMAELKVAANPHVLTTRGLGSCLGITLYDPLKKIGGLAHPMLPDINNSRAKPNPARFVNSCLDEMIKELTNFGCLKNRLQAKVFGGAHMFSFISQDSAFSVGEKNIDMAFRALSNYNIPIVAEDIRGNFGRTIEFDLTSGAVRIRTLYFGEKTV